MVFKGVFRVFWGVIVFSGFIGLFMCLRIFWRFWCFFFFFWGGGGGGSGVLMVFRVFWFGF